LVDGVVWQVEGKYVSENDDVGIPANEEEGAGTTDDTVRTVINVVSAHKLQSTTITKKQYQVWLKDYMKKVLERLKTENPDRVADFQKGAQAHAKKILTSFSDYDFYMGEGVRNLLLPI
jgi:hypothetical protein